VNNVEYDNQLGYTVANTGGAHTQDIINNYFINGPEGAGGNSFFQMNSTFPRTPAGI